VEIARVGSLEAAAAARIIRLHPDDDVAVAVDALEPGTILAAGDSAVPVRDRVPPGHKVSLVALVTRQSIRKYGQTIGFASRDIPAGSHVHVHNCSGDSFERAFEFGVDARLLPTTARDARRTFRGYLRPDGRAGTRNYVLVIGTTNCSASVARLIAERFPRDELAAHPSIDGILAITHKGGCSNPIDGPDHLQLERVLAGFAQHPNVGGCLIVGLGCEMLQVRRLIERQELSGARGTAGITGIDGGGGTTAQGAPGTTDRGQVPFLVIQEEGGTRRTVEAGIDALRALLPAAGVERTELAVSDLVLGLQCGGSDGYSGVTANPALGVASDLLVAQGGTAILAETTEWYGAEHLLVRRAATREVGEQVLERIGWWEWYTGIYGATIDTNPTPGNKAGGLTTIFEKSLGAVAKGGTAPIGALYRYGERVTSHGLVLMDTPGNDPISLTGVVAGGANICAFTTGRGSVYGCKPSPCLKIASNSALFRHLEEDMDVDAGVILDGVDVQRVGRAIFERLVEVASGATTKSEALGVGDEEFAPWTIGPIL
jgi:altronate hydrolase